MMNYIYYRCYVHLAFYFNCFDIFMFMQLFMYWYYTDFPIMPLDYEPISESTAVSHFIIVPKSAIRQGQV